MVEVDTTFRDQARKAAERGRAIQAAALKAEKAAKKNGKDGDKPPRTRDRKYPEPPLPKQHQDKPGEERKLRPHPMFEAPDYRGSDKLRDMVAIVTGGDSGIGRAIAVLFAREGADVAVVYLDEDPDAETTRRAVEKEGRRCILIPGDVGDPRFCEHVVAQTVKTFGKLDILVNNAAFQQHAARIEDISDEQFEWTLRTNLSGYFYMARAAVKHLHEGASIINCGSVTGIFGSKNLLDYSLTKGGIHAFTRSLSEHLLARGIRVNAVAPGPVWTPLNPADKTADKVAEFGADTGMKRPAQPEEIAPAFVFLAAPSCSSYITGEILPIIGGYAAG
jgi:NAD(P)-dependent dehydrogenase (short-subunit alcohol dehydrogenase family)